MKKFLKSIKTGWLKFAHAVGVVNTTILLTVFYIVFIGLYAILIGFPKKIFEHFRKQPESYYIAHPSNKDYKYPF